MGVKTAPDRIAVKVGETRTAIVAFQNVLESGELLTGTPTVVEVTTSDLTIDNKAVNSATLTVDGASVVAGQAVQFRFAGQLFATAEYTIRVTCGTDATPAQTLVSDVLVVVEE